MNSLFAIQNFFFTYLTFLTTPTPMHFFSSIHTNMYTFTITTTFNCKKWAVYSTAIALLFNTRFYQINIPLYTQEKYALFFMAVFTKITIVTII